MAKCETSKLKTKIQKVEVDHEDTKELMDKYLRQKADNPRNVWKRRTVKRVGLPIVRIEDFYVQGHESDEDRLFCSSDFDSRDRLGRKENEFLRLRQGTPGIDGYVNTIAVGTNAQELFQLEYVFDEMVMLTLEEIGIEVREEDVTVEDKMPDLPRTVHGRVHLSEEIRLLRIAVLNNFEDGLIWMYRVVRLEEISERSGGSAPMEWRRAKGVMEHFMRVIERAVFDRRRGLMRRVWVALYQKLRVYFHTRLELEVHGEIFEEDCHTWKYVSRLLLGARAYCRVVCFNREETSLFQSALLTPRERGLLY